MVDTMLQDNTFNCGIQFPYLSIDWDYRIFRFST